MHKIHTCRVNGQRNHHKYCVGKKKYICVENVIHQGLALRLWIYMSLNQGLGFGMYVCVHVYMHMRKHVGVVSLWALIHTVSLAEPH